MAATAANVHFEDRFENGVLHFDYRLRDGVVQTSNALALMRSVGLDVGLMRPIPRPPNAEGTCSAMKAGRLQSA